MAYIAKVNRVKNPRSRRDGAVAKRGTKRVELKEVRHQKRAQKVATAKQAKPARRVDGVPLSVAVEEAPRLIDTVVASSSRKPRTRVEIDQQRRIRGKVLVGADEPYEEELHDDHLVAAGGLPE